MTEAELATGLARAFRAFADSLEATITISKAEERAAARGGLRPVPAKKILPRPAGMEDWEVTLRFVLSEFDRLEKVNGRGLTREEARQVALDAGVDPRGLGGHYARSKFLVTNKKKDERHLTAKGRRRLAELAA